MDISKIILKNFNELLAGHTAKLFEKQIGYEAWIFNMPMSNDYGVGFECNSNLVFNDGFANVKMRKLVMNLEGKNRDILILTTSNKLNKRNFAKICSDFVDPSNRNEILNDPGKWWSEWKELIGNKSVDVPEYSVIGEMMLYEYFLLNPEQYKDVIWAGADKHNHDVITFDKEFEVKSTTRRTGVEVNISSEFQLCDNGKELYLVFFRFIRNGDTCIDDMVERLVNRCHCSAFDIEKKLEACGYLTGATSRKKKYYCEECRIYKVEEGKFPILTNNSFAGGKRPTGINHIDYEITLENLPYSVIDVSNFNL